MDRDLVLITGASSDIGLALIRRLIASGDQPGILAHYYSSAVRLEQLRAELDFPSLIPLSADLSSESDVRELAARISGEFGIPNRMVHLPALKLQYERFTKIQWDRFEVDLNIQVRSAVILLQNFLPAMAKMAAARLVFVLSSTTRAIPPKFMSAYGIVKQAQLGLMRALASEYGETGISINAVSPSMVDTRFLDDIPEVARNMSAAASPRKRNAKPEEVARAIEFLLSDGAAYINGIEVPVAGGSVF
jgi:3-oxoacyl-[acyl-carrier protein] reductase